MWGLRAQEHLSLLPPQQMLSPFFALAAVKLRPTLKAE